jgi:hypothetical protein
LDKTLPVVKDILTNSIFPQKELETFIRNQQQKLQVSLQKNDVVARRTLIKPFMAIPFMALLPNLILTNTLQRDDLLTHFKQMYQPSNCTIIIAGRLSNPRLTCWPILLVKAGITWQHLPILRSRANLLPIILLQRKARCPAVCHPHGHTVY